MKLPALVIYYKSISLLLLLSLSASPYLSATHIVGGEMGYRCLGNNQYEISLTIFRDCFFGNPNAYFDDPASIGIFDSQNNLLQDIRIELMGDDTLAPVLTNECLVVPPDVCVHTTTYRTTVELLPRTGGYQLAYQRCCRNQTIQNIIDPLATGATYGVQISERALLECNSSAEFLEWPPLYICANEPILFDQSAIDRDGDSIVYRLCTPLQGANQTIPRPQPPNNPPYEEVVWNAGYGVDNMLNGLPGGEPLRINPETGLLTGIPNTIGQFVVGICAEEYRNGELISTSRRDFQYNVGLCGQVNAAFFAPEIQCDGLEVSFENRSQEAAEYLWYYDFGSDPNAFSTEVNPTYTYPDTGRYNVALIAAPGTICADTFIQEIQLLPRTLFPDFSLDTLSCGDSLVLQITDRSTAVNADIEAWSWTLNGEVFAEEPNPILNLGQGGAYQIGLQLSADNGCVRDSFLQPLTLRPFTVQLTQEEWRICTGDTVALFPDANPNLRYSWSPVPLFDDPTLPNPLVSPVADTLYRVQITDPATACSVDREVRVLVSLPLTLDLVDTLSSCESQFELLAQSPTATSYEWSRQANFTSIFATDPMVVVTPFREEIYYLAIEDNFGCRLVDSVWVSSQAVNVTTPLNATLCVGDILAQTLANADPEDTLTVNWQPDDLLFQPTNSTSVTWRFPNAGTYELSYIAENQLLCRDTGNYLVTVIDTANILADYNFVQCSGLNVLFSSTSPHAEVLEWNFGDANNPGAGASGASVTHTYTEAGNYTVQISFGAGLACADTLFLPITVVEDGPIQPAFDWDYETCRDTLVISLTDQTSGAEIVAHEWYLANELFATTQTTNLGFSTGGSYEISLVTTAVNGCRDTISELIEPSFIEINLIDTVLACPAQLTPLYPDADTSLIYQWSPTIGLDDPNSPNPFVTLTESMAYAVTITDPASICQREASVWVDVSPTITYNLTGPIATCELLADLVLDVNPDIRTQWYTDSELSILASSAASWQAPVDGLTTYYTLLTDDFGCQIVDSITIDGQGVWVDVESPSLICPDDSIRLMTEVIGTYPAISYEWSPGALIIDGADTATPLVAPIADTRFLVTITNSAGCQLDTSILVPVVTNAPMVDILPPLDTIFPGESVSLSATFNPDFIYLWQPAMGLSVTNIPNPIASPESTTRYTVTVTDRNGCTDQATSLIVVFNSPCTNPYLFVPSAFSPNGDQLNDELKVAGNIIDEFYLVIYNRWGQEVFSSRDQQQGWDGTFEGRELPADVYGYYLEVRCVDDALFQDKGNITLIR